MRMSRVKITIFGSGAIASLFAARLSAVRYVSRPQFELKMFGHWQAQIKKITIDGLQFIEEDGGKSEIRIAATMAAAEVQETDIALVCVKSYQTESMVTELRDCLAQDGLALSLQNGWGNGEILSAALGADSVSRGITTQGATILQPGVLVHAGGGDTIFEENPAQKSKLDFIVQCFNSCGFPGKISSDFESLFWQKLIINAAINPLTALLHLRNGQLLSSPGIRDILARIIEEAVTVAASSGYSFNPADMLAKVKSVCRNTAGNFSSMLQDVLNQRPTEIDAITGAIVQQGFAAGIATPANEKILQLFSQQKGRRISADKLAGQIFH